MGLRVVLVRLAGTFVLAERLARAALAEARLAGAVLVVVRVDVARLGAGFAAALIGLPPRASATIALTMAPPREIAVPLANSSSQSIASVFFSLSMKGSRNA